MTNIQKNLNKAKAYINMHTFHGENDIKAVCGSQTATD